MILKTAGQASARAVLWVGLQPDWRSADRCVKLKPGFLKKIR